MMLRLASGSVAVAARGAPLRAAVASRGLSSLVPLDEEYLGTPHTLPTAATAPVTTVSTLSNGAKVVTYESSQLGATVGVVVGSGSRDESTAQAGASLQLEGMAYKLTQGRSSIRLMRDIENAGGTLAASRGREKMMYVAECPPESAGVVLSALAESVVLPKITPWEMSDASAKLSQIILHRHEESTAAQVEEALHAAAFGDSFSLGKPLTPGLCRLSVEGLKEFREARYKASSITAVGVNVPHEEFKSAAAAALEAADTAPPAARPAAKYVGGELRMKKDCGSTSVSMAFAAPSGSASGAATYEVLAALLETRAKAASPAASAFNLAYSDAGLIGVTGTAPNGQAGVLSEALASCFMGLAQGPSEAEVTAAIKSAKIARGLKMEKPLHALLTLAESAAVGADPAAALSALDAVTPSAVNAAAAAAVKSSMSMAVVGNVLEVPHKEEIAAML